MRTKLRILLLEDDVADAELITQELESSGLSFSLKRVETEHEFRHELGEATPDVILSDHGLPSFSGFRALEITQEEHPELPFIFVSGSNDQGMVAHMHDEGAADYVFKRDIKDLKPAIENALETPPETPPVLTDTDAALQPELPLPLPPAPQPPPRTFPPVIGQLRFCPCCHQARDEAGRIVRMEDYCDARVEIVVIRETCEACERMRWLDLGM